MLKALFILEVFPFCPEFFVMYRNGLMRRLRLISKSMTSQSEQQIIAIHISSNISRGISNRNRGHRGHVRKPRSFKSTFFKVFMNWAGT